MAAVLRLGGLKEYLRSSLWVLPTLFVLAAVTLATVLGRTEPSEGTPFESVVFNGSAEGARQLLSTLAGAMITVTGLTFSLTVVALQMAAGQYSPRVMRGFLSDRGVQLVLSALVGTFAYCVAVLRVVREDELEGEFLPRTAVSVGVLCSFAALAMLVYFIHHITRQLRVETILHELAMETLETIEAVYPDEEDGASPVELPDPGEHAVRIHAKRSGYLLALERDGLVEQARKARSVVRLRMPLGRHVTAGTTLAWVWRDDGSAFLPDEQDGLDRLVHDRIQLGYERTLQQDVSFGFRQMVDIGSKALSTGMNDPTTAVEALGQLTVVLCHLTTRRVGNAVDADDDGITRLVLPRPDFADYLQMSCDQLRRYGAVEPAVILALLDLLADVAEVSCSPSQRSTVEDQVQRTVQVAGTELDGIDMERIRHHAASVRRTLAGDRRPERGLLAW